MSRRIARVCLIVLLEALAFTGCGGSGSGGTAGGTGGGSSTPQCDTICNCACNGDSDCLKECPAACVSLSVACQKCAASQPCSSLQGIQGPPAACSSVCQ